MSILYRMKKKSNVVGANIYLFLRIEGPTNEEKDNVVAFHYLMVLFFRTMKFGHERNIVIKNYQPYSAACTTSCFQSGALLVKFVAKSVICKVD
jgi:hypothetical protein